MIDIRHLPTYYINCPSQVDKKAYMEKELTTNNFTNYKRFIGIECRDGRAGCFLSHLRCAYTALKKETSKYILILEDDVKFNNIDAINVAVNKAILNNGFDVFVCVESDIEQLFMPPKEKCYTTHFLLYNRQRIPGILNIFYMNWLEFGIIDQWMPCHTNVAIYLTNACEQNKTLESMIHNHWNSYIVITDTPLIDNAYNTVSELIGRKIPWTDISIYGAYSFNGNHIDFSINDSPIQRITLNTPVTDKLNSALMIQYKYSPEAMLFHVWNTDKRVWVKYNPVIGE